MAQGHGVVNVIGLIGKVGRYLKDHLSFTNEIEQAKHFTYSKAGEEAMKYMAKMKLDTNEYKILTYDSATGVVK